MRRAVPALHDCSVSSSTIKLAVLVSGSGTTLQNLIDRIHARELDARIEIVIGSRSDLVGLDRSRKAELKTAVVDRREYATCTALSHRVFGLVDDAKVDLVCMAGWLCLLDLPQRYHGRVMNIHPALLPSFGGRGMYGRKVHE